jgi:hypothetical protein
MNNFEKYLVPLIPNSFPIRIREFDIPNIHHCIGTGKLLGTKYAKAILEECKCNDIIYETSLEHLCCLMRSYIVLDDFIKDSNLSSREAYPIQVVLLNIESQSKHLIHNLSDNAACLWAKYLKLYESAYVDFDKRNPFRSIINKCSFAFLPFELKLFHQLERSHYVKEVIEYYLFALQLLDDFHDIEEDQHAPKNHNLFLLNVPINRQLSIYGLRHLLALPLLNYIDYELSNIITKLSGQILKEHIGKSLLWLKKIKDHLSHLPMDSNIFPNSFKSFIFHYNDVLYKKSPANKNDDYSHIDEICAESMHTVADLGVTND